MGNNGNYHSRGNRGDYRGAGGIIAPITDAQLQKNIQHELETWLLQLLCIVESAVLAVWPGAVRTCPCPGQFAGDVDG